MERRDFLKSLFGVAAAAAAVSVVGLPTQAEAAPSKAAPQPDRSKNPVEAIPDSEPKDGAWSQYYYRRYHRPYWRRPYWHRPRPYWGPRYYYRPRYHYRPHYYRRRYW